MLTLAGSGPKKILSAVRGQRSLGRTRRFAPGRKLLILERLSSRFLDVPIIVIDTKKGCRPPQVPLAARCYICYVSVIRTVTERELRNDSAAVLRDVQAGQSVIVTRNGTPVAELRPLSSRRFVPRAVIAEAARSALRINAPRFRADLDALVDQRVDG